MKIVRRYALDHNTLSEPPVPSETWEWDRQRHVAMGQFAKRLIEELSRAEQLLEQMAEELEDSLRFVDGPGTRRNGETVLAAYRAWKGANRG